MTGTTCLILAGDVMTGRGVDQILPAPGRPHLRESYVVDARAYVDLAEQANGPIPKPVDPAWPWGDALAVMDEADPAFRLMNLETSVTSREEFAPGKSLHYRMNPANIDCLEAARVDVWSLANNHVLDLGVPGLLETLHTLHQSGLATAGAGEDEREAWAPVVVQGAGTRFVVCAVGHASSGVPARWAAGPGSPGVAVLPDLSDRTSTRVADVLDEAAAPGDVRVVSVHWGSNWGYEVPSDHRRFAQRLIEGGVHVVHGHSSHHPRPVEVYRGGLVLYGCGDLVNDYEGISGYEAYRDDLRLLYMAALDSVTAEIQGLAMVPFRARQMRLSRVAGEDASWLARTMDEICRPFGTSVSLDVDGAFVLLWDS
ncbi:MAG TPA: CapA family protein [Nocardioidaceae bacterium]|nr:CapA family protein [Nocardioidaceae bacterium]